MMTTEHGGCRRSARVGAAGIAAMSSIGAGAIHAAAAGIHAEHETLSRLFVVTAMAQLAAGVVLLVRPSRIAAGATVVASAVAVGGWALTRTTGIAWIEGLGEAEAAQFADAACAALGATAVIAGTVAGWRVRAARATAALAVPAVAVGILAVTAMMSATTHVHSHDTASAAAPAHARDIAGAAGSDHGHDDGHGAAPEHADDPPVVVADEPTPDSADVVGAGGHGHEASTWPRPWDPDGPIDFSGVPGVSAAQQARAEDLVARTVRDLPAFADVGTLADRGFRSIGDEATGFEHFINIDHIRDDAFLDPTRPESLVYRVDGDARTLVSAMFIARDAAVDDPELVEFGGPLMQWHVHDNLCWGLGDDGTPRVVGVTNADGECEPGSVNAGGDNPMVHVWIAPHPCGPFAALEGHGAGQASGDGPRVDQCEHGHEPADIEPATTPYDPELPIDLSGVEGVTPAQQAFAENLVAVTVVRLPTWEDPQVAEAAGFRSIGDGATGHEHYVNWGWLDDDVWLDPDAPESLVYAPQPDGTKRLVAAMYMLPRTVALEDVPDWGGRLMQWHVHDDLCYTDDPEAPRVAGLTTPGGPCAAPLVRHPERPMIHVWITPHECGPFAALEGVGGGAIPEGEERWCDHAHGS